MPEHSVNGCCRGPLSASAPWLSTWRDAGCDPARQDDYGRDVLVSLASRSHPVDPQVTDLFLSAGCRTNLDGCKRISDERRLRFDQILKEHAEWKENLDRMSAEHSPANAFYGPDWGRRSE